MPSKPILTIFAGPNGSGKSTIIRSVFQKRGPQGLPNYVNADDIVQELKVDKAFKDFSQEQLEQEAFHEAGRQRGHYLELGVSFTFETVFSHESKLDLMRRAEEKGYFIELFFVATCDPDLNVARVKQRVEQGGHNVSEEKIRKRYERSISYLPQACTIANQIFIYDNSRKPVKGQHSAFALSARIDNDNLKLILNNKYLPHWITKALKAFSKIKSSHYDITSM